MGNRTFGATGPRPPRARVTVTFGALRAANGQGSSDARWPSGRTGGRHLRHAPDARWFEEIPPGVGLTPV